MDGPWHDHVSGYLTVTSSAAEMRPSALIFGAEMVDTVPSVQVLSEELSWEGNLSASWLDPGCSPRTSWKLLRRLQREATVLHGSSLALILWRGFLGFRNNLRLKLKKIFLMAACLHCRDMS